jgi:hypothetical protein
MNMKFTILSAALAAQRIKYDSEELCRAVRGGGTG